MKEEDKKKKIHLQLEIPFHNWFSNVLFSSFISLFIVGCFCNYELLCILILQTRKKTQIFRFQLI
jgi:hypothetical protein